MIASALVVVKAAKLPIKLLARINALRRNCLTIIRQFLFLTNHSMKKFVRDSTGAAAIEYVLIITLITIGIVGALAFFAEDLIAFISNVPI